VYQTEQQHSNHYATVYGPISCPVSKPATAGLVVVVGQSLNEQFEGVERSLGIRADMRRLCQLTPDSDEPLHPQRYARPSSTERIANLIPPDVSARPAATTRHAFAG